MKIVKSAIVVLSVIMLTFSCSSDDDSGSNNVDEDLIVGTWLLISDVDEDGIEYISDGDCPYFLDFTDNTINGREFYGENCDQLDNDQPLSYTLENGLLTFSEYGEIFELSVEQLTETTLRLRYDYEDEGESFFDITTFTKQ